MEFSTITETHIKGVPRMCDEIKNALQKMFPDRYVNYLHETKHHTLIGYKVTGTITVEQEKDIQSLMTSVVDKSVKDHELAVQRSKKFMETWIPMEVKAHGDKILSRLHKLHAEAIGYVNSHKVDDPVMAQELAQDSDEIAKVYHLWHQKKFSEAALHLLNSSEVIKGSMDSRTYDAIMKHYKVA